MVTFSVEQVAGDPDAFCSQNYAISQLMIWINTVLASRPAGQSNEEWRLEIRQVFASGMKGVLNVSPIRKTDVVKTFCSARNVDYQYDTILGALVFNIPDGVDLANPKELFDYLFEGVRL